jgi:hypothetical protein
MSLRALFEPCELDRPPQEWRLSAPHETRLGVNGFGPVYQNKRASPAGAKPGNTEKQVDTRVGTTSAIRSPRWIPDTHHKTVRPKPCILYDLS